LNKEIHDKNTTGNLTEYPDLSNQTDPLNEKQNKSGPTIGSLCEEDDLPCL